MPEKEGWVSAHYREPYHGRRIAKLPAKLEQLGVLNLPRSAQILDTCCGGGEAMGALREFGFHEVWGADSLRQRSWSVRAGRYVSCDVRHLPFRNNSFDIVLNLHALHHLGDGQGVREFLDEAFRVLKPGGRLLIIDFASTPQIRLIFWLMRKRLGLVTGSLRNFADIVIEEWEYLSTYLDDWPQARNQLRTSAFLVDTWKSGLFLFYLRLRKPASVV